MKLSALVEGPAVIVPARVAVMLEYRLPLDDLRVQVRGKDVELDAVLLALHTAALMYVEATRDELTSAVGSGVAAVSEVPARSTVMTTSEVACTADCTTRAVTLAAVKEQLLGAKRDGRWWFEIDDVAAWVATRT